MEGITPQTSAFKGSLSVFYAHDSLTLGLLPAQSFEHLRAVSPAPHSPPDPGPGYPCQGVHLSQRKSKSSPRPEAQKARILSGATSSLSRGCQAQPGAQQTTPGHAKAWTTALSLWPGRTQACRAAQGPESLQALFKLVQVLEDLEF